jgi:hypothetical protein
MNSTLVKGFSALTLLVLMTSVTASNPQAFAINGHGISYGPQFGGGQYLKYTDGLTINGKSFDISKHTTTIKTQNLFVNDKSDITLKIYQHSAAQKVQHAIIFLNLRSGDPQAYQTNTYIEWDKNFGASKQDPSGLLKSVTATVKNEGQLMYLTFHIVPNQTLDTSHIIIRAWDSNLSTGQATVLNAIKFGFMPESFSSVAQ